MLSFFKGGEWHWHSSLTLKYAANKRTQRKKQSLYSQSPTEGAKQRPLDEAEGQSEGGGGKDIHFPVFFNPAIDKDATIDQDHPGIYLSIAVDQFNLSELRYNIKLKLWCR